MYEQVTVAPSRHGCMFGAGSCNTHAVAVHLWPRAAEKSNYCRPEGFAGIPVFYLDLFCRVAVYFSYCPTSCLAAAPRTTRQYMFAIRHSLKQGADLLARGPSSTIPYGLLGPAGRFRSPAQLLWDKLRGYSRPSRFMLAQAILF